MVLVFGISLLGLNGCNIKTPEIHGIVLDEETKQPVEEAWVRATLEIKSKSLQGDVHSVLSVDPPHTRTDERGRFVIPSKKFKTPPFPIGLGTQVESFDVGAKTVSRIGGIQIPIDDLKKKKVEVRIYIRSDEKIYEEQFQKYLKEGIKEERALELIECKRCIGIVSGHGRPRRPGAHSQLPPGRFLQHRWHGVPDGTARHPPAPRGVAGGGRVPAGTRAPA